jgi:NADH dehydrogenase
MILVAGASSKPGQKLIPMLVDKGYQVRALTRDPKQLDFAHLTGVEVIEGDLRQPDTLLRACEGAEAVVSSVTAVMNIGDNNVHTVDDAGNYLLVEAARRSGVKRFVFVSAYGAAKDHAVDFFRIKYGVEEHIKSSQVPYTILRPAAFMETWCARIGRQVLNNETVTVYGNGKNPINFISVKDVAKFLIFALEDSRLCNKTLTIGGPQNLTFDEVVAAYERIKGRRSKRKYISAAQLRLTNRFYSFFNKTKARFAGMRHDLATSNWQVDMSEIVKHYPVNLMSLDGIANRQLKY